MHDVLQQVLDDGELLEIQPEFAKNIVVGFGRMDGATVGVVSFRIFFFCVLLVWGIFLMFLVFL